MVSSRRTAWRRCSATATLLLTLVPAASLRALPAQRGIALGLFSSDAEERYEPYLDEIVAQGSSHVSLVTVWYQRDVHATAIRPRPGYTPSEANLQRTIAAARARGLQVMLFPILGLEVRETHEWRGRIQPEDWDAWFASYRGYLLRMATLAAAHEVAVLSVGSELLSTERFTERWTALIAEVRRVYRGQLLYSANWDHYEPVSFWSQVDLLGVTGYYELTRDDDPTAEALVRSWQRWQQPLVAFARRVDRPLIFTEIGYPALDGANRYPWDETRRVAVDLDEQARCYRAFVAAWDDVPELAGVYFWNWFGPGGAQDSDYTPRGKPAAGVIHRWYQGGATP